MDDLWPSSFSYGLAESGETAVWLASPDGHRRYLGGDGDSLTWVPDGLLIASSYGKARLLPQAALDSAAPADAARAVAPPSANDVWGSLAEPGGRRVAYWLAHEPAHHPKLDLHVVDPEGDWSIGQVTTGQYSDSYRLGQIAAFGSDGALYWVERGDDRTPTRLWRLTRAGRSEMPVSVKGVTDLQRVGNELALVGTGVLFDPRTGKTRPLPQGKQGGIVHRYWFSADGTLAAMTSGPPDEKPQGYLFRLGLDTLEEVGRWAGIGYGFDAQDAFYYGVEE